MDEGAYRAGSLGSDADKWQAVADSPRFVELMRSRRQFVVGALVAFSAYTLAFLLACGYAPGLMAEAIVDGFTVGMAAGVVYLLLIWLLAWAFLRRSDRTWDPISREIADGVMSTMTTVPSVDDPPVPGSEVRR